MTLRSQPLLLASAAAAVLGLGGIALFARDLTAQGQGSEQPSLIDLLDQIGRPQPNAEPLVRPAPKPPTRPPQSPALTRSCAAPLRERQQRLVARVSQLRTNPQRVSIDPTNYGNRFRRDAFGNPLDPSPRLVVLHETVYGLQSAINTFRTPHPRDEDQVSYHALVGQDGAVVLLLDPDKRAFGAGNSAFRGEWAVTNPAVGGSVNNFALHISLETPPDGEHAGPGHSGYTQAQYDGLAALLTVWMQTYGITADRITTHQAVDLAGERADPRSFQWSELQGRLQDLQLLC
jgi:N-acetyl-anhydromuramyl-L-alanine amidase AmpD